MMCKFCGEMLGINEEAERHAGECPVMLADYSPVEDEIKEVTPCQSVNTPEEK